MHLHDLSFLSTLCRKGNFAGLLSSVVGADLGPNCLQRKGSYRQVLVKFKNVSRTSKSFSNSFRGLKVIENY